MNIINEIAEFNNTGKISDAFIEQLRADYIVRGNLYKYFKNNTNRPFCICLLKTFITLRENTENNILIEDLMFSSYLVGRHNVIGDAMLIWEAKSIDFDSYCGMDGQLIAFAGKEETIMFFEESIDSRAEKALQYLTEWAELGYLDHYFEHIERQYWLGDNL